MLKKYLLMMLLLCLLAGCIGGQGIDDIQALTKEVNNNSEDEIEVNNEPKVTNNTSVKEETMIAITKDDFLKTNGVDIKTHLGTGDKVSLRGINVGGYLLQEFWMTPTRDSEHIKDETSLFTYLEEAYGKEETETIIKVYQDSYFTEADFDRLSDLGINVIRLPFWYRNLVDSDGELYDNWFQRFDWFIEEAGARGIYVILDFHGAPGSQNGSDHSGYDGGQDKEGASNFFFGEETLVLENQELFYSLWEIMATRYKDNPIVAGYDLLNEPYCTYRYNASVSETVLHNTLWSVYDEAYKRIREIDPDHMIIMEATWDPKDLPSPDVYGWENVVYEYHNYLYDDYNNVNGGQISNMIKKINLIHTADYNVPSLMGEFNYFDSYDAWDEGLALLNDEDIHWTLWTYKTTSDYGNWGLYHHTTGDLNLEKVDNETIKTFYAKVGDVIENKRLLEVVKKHLQ